jgi:hypothetical protein
MATTTKARDTKQSRTSDRRGARPARRRDRGEEPRITAWNLTAADRRFLEKKASGLSPSTLRAKWIHTTDEHADRPGRRSRPAPLR